MFTIMRLAGSCLDQKAIFRANLAPTKTPSRRCSLLFWSGLCLVSSLLSGCSVNLADPNLRSGWYLGLVKVERPSQSDSINAVGLRSFGLGIDQGVILGFREMETVVVPPGTCSFTLIAKDTASLRHAMTVLTQMEGKACTVDFSEPSH